MPTQLKREMQASGLLFLLLVTGVIASQPVIVNIPNGPISGTHLTVDGKQVLEFLGIPFAEPPIGPLRFREPKPLTKTWTEPLVANKPPKGCLQHPMPVTFMYFPEHLLPMYSEDCLYLNVWTPTIESGEKKSVMVWIHGGGFSTGEGLPFCNGKAMASIGDVVVVTVQYRLGFMGFARFDSQLVPGNNGLFDQQLALKWVHDNIAQFGGDPQSVTLFGQSAGSASVAYHLVNEESGRYFQRGIMQSGSFSDGSWAFNPNTHALETLNREIAAKYVNCDQVAAIDLLNCLQGKTEDELQTLIVSFAIKNQWRFILGPTIDGKFLSRAPVELLESGNVNRKDLIVGLTESEGTLMVVFMAMGAMMANNISVPVEELITEKFIRGTIDNMMEYYPVYPHKPSPIAKEMIVLKSMSHAFPNRGDLNAIAMADNLALPLECDVYRFVDTYRPLHDTVYFYEMAHLPSQLMAPVQRSDWMKFSHTDDIPFTFALPIVYPGIRNMTPEELLLSRRIIGDWTHFAKTGKPKDPNWRPFTMEKKEFYRYRLKSSPEEGGLKRDQCVFWTKMLPIVMSLTCETDSESRCKILSSIDPDNGGFTVKDEL